jgi:hypothetical protein
VYGYSASGFVDRKRNRLDYQNTTKATQSNHMAILEVVKEK